MAQPRPCLAFRQPLEASTALVNHAVGGGSKLLVGRRARLAVSGKALQRFLLFRHHPLR